MKNFDEAKRVYESAEIPAELDSRVRAGMKEGARRARRVRTLRRSLGSAAACLAVLFAGLNLFPTFAAAAADVPVVGGFFQVLTVRSWERTGDGLVVHVDQPAVSAQGSGSEMPELSKKVNQEIRERVDARVAEGEKTVAEYKEAFLATGGTEDEWAEHDNKVTVTYDVESQTEDTVSFVLHTMISTSVGDQQDYYYNLDLKKDRELTLADLLGDDWVNVCNKSIKAQMAASEDPSVYFDASMGGFETVDETTGFYINAAGNPVVVFPRATVAIGAMGQVEFEITK
ncbi:MAG: DUF3298 and DUF4163 domain-containing protein [Oscillibacter sp.]|jgi:hypothetical protein|nr:DUF3298 and DUF4163 domain-containing protein [Oscillibacter sp.]